MTAVSAIVAVIAKWSKIEAEVTENADRITRKVAYPCVADAVTLTTMITAEVRKSCSTGLFFAFPILLPTS